MTQTIILFNGPPRSGKDTAAKALMQHNHNPLYHISDWLCFDKMSMPIKRSFAALVSQHCDRWGDVDHLEPRKEKVMSLFGVSYRQWQIDFSEKFMKPLYGEDVFAKLFTQRQRLQHPNAVILVPDCGFDIEYNTLVESFGEKNVFVIKLYRDGCSFAGDSRYYLKVGDDFPNAADVSLRGGGRDRTNRQVYHLLNDFDIDGFEEAVRLIVHHLLESRS